jgi:type II secretory pathway pseudopilin PulG
VAIRWRCSCLPALSRGATRWRIPHWHAPRADPALARWNCNTLSVTSASIRVMDVIALVISILSLLLAGAGTLLSNKRASEALEESRKVKYGALWSGAQEAVQRLVGFDPTTEPAGDRLVNLRIAMIALTDELEGWKGFDTWLEAERALGATLGRQVMESAKPADTVELRLANLDPYHRWAIVLSQNLRHFRSVGYDAEAVTKLSANAMEQTTAIHQKHGWQLPLSTIAGVQPLD